MALPTAQQTERALAHHLQAFDARDVDALLSDYPDEGAILTPEGVVRGHTQLRSLFEMLLRDVFTPGTSFTMLRQTVEGELAYIVWSAESDRYRIPLGTDTFLVRDGKIVLQTFAAKMEKKGG